MATILALFALRQLQEQTESQTIFEGLHQKPMLSEQTFADSGVIVYVHSNRKTHAGELHLFIGKLLENHAGILSIPPNNPDHAFELIRKNAKGAQFNKSSPEDGFTVFSKEGEEFSAETIKRLIRIASF